MEIKKDKYCLKGAYYELLEKINFNLIGIIPNRYRKEVYKDLLDLFFRMQGSRKSPEEAIGKSFDDFINEIVASYYDNIEIRDKFFQIVNNALLNSLFCMMTFIISIDNINDFFTSGLLFYSVIGVIWGIIVFIIQKNVLKRVRETARSIIKTALILLPMYFVFLSYSFVLKLLQSLYIESNIIKGIFILQIIMFIIINIINWYIKVRNVNGK